MEKEPRNKYEVEVFTSLCLQVESEDKHFFAGTLSGDVLMVNLQGNRNIFCGNLSHNG